MTFADLRLAEPILRAITTEGYEIPTPIQAQAIPHVRDGSDLLGCAQTGTGKTAAFALPLLNRLLEAKTKALAPKADGNEIEAADAKLHDKKVAAKTGGHRKHDRHPTRVIRALILSPTRELAQQIADSFKAYGKHTGLRGAVIYGGVGQGSQTAAIQAGIDILVATPGRLHDLIDQGYINLSHVEAFVLDEADRMLDMGFIEPIRQVVKLLPKQRQTLMFSATMPKEIRHLAESILNNPVRIEVVPESTAAETVEQKVYFVEKKNKPLLLKHFLEHVSVTRTIVFTRTKHGADHVTKFLNREGLRAEAIHGDKTQGQRQRALANFKANKTPILVATDIAARGLDVDNISHVVNFDVPHEPETYVHRIGRTGRAGASGDAVSFCMADERPFLTSIERMLKKTVPVVTEHPFVDPTPYNPRGSSSGGGGGGRSHGGSRGFRGQNAWNRSSGGGGQKPFKKPARAGAGGGGGSEHGKSHNTHGSANSAGKKPGVGQGGPGGKRSTFRRREER